MLWSMRASRSPTRAVVGGVGSDGYVNAWGGLDEATESNDAENTCNGCDPVRSDIRRLQQRQQ